MLKIKRVFQLQRKRIRSPRKHLYEPCQKEAFKVSKSTLTQQLYFIVTRQHLHNHHPLQTHTHTPACDRHTEGDFQNKELKTPASIHFSVSFTLYHLLSPSSVKVPYPPQKNMTP